MKKSTKTWLWIAAGVAAYYVLERKSSASSGSSADPTGGVYAGAKGMPASTPPTVASGSPQDPNYDPTGGVYAGAAPPVDPTGGVYANAALEGYISPTRRRLR